MKPLLKISFVLNLVLAGGLILALWSGHNRVLHTAAPELVQTPPLVEATTVSPPPPSSEPEPKTFRWNQLEARDYHIFVKNLRGIGCPEPTLRAIVSADVYAAYETPVKVLERRIAELHAGIWTNQLAEAGTETALKSELQQIPEEEAAMINNLLGVMPAPLQAASDAAAKDGESEQDSAIVLPLALQGIDLAAMNLSDDQKQVIAGVRQNFLAQIGGTNQDPDDPAYLQRWQQAQPAADDMLRAMLGTSIYQNYQLTALQNGQLAAAPNAQR